MSSGSAKRTRKLYLIGGLALAGIILIAIAVASGVNPQPPAATPEQTAQAPAATSQEAAPQISPSQSASPVLPSTEPNGQDSGSQPSAALVLPAEEAQLISLISDAQSESQQAENDMQVGGIKAKRDNAICRVMTSLNVSDWVGTVSLVDSNSDGKGVFKVTIAPDIDVETVNNAFSDAFDHTLIEPGSPVFNAASALKLGQIVLFSGTFLPGAGGNCLDEGSLTLHGGLESPEFIFRFSKVAPYNPSLYDLPHPGSNLSMSSALQGVS